MSGTNNNCDDWSGMPPPPPSRSTTIQFSSSIYNNRLSNDQRYSMMPPPPRNPHPQPVNRHSTYSTHHPMYQRNDHSNRSGCRDQDTRQHQQTHDAPRQSYSLSGNQHFGNHDSNQYSWKRRQDDSNGQYQNHKRIRFSSSPGFQNDRNQSTSRSNTSSSSSSDGGGGHYVEKFPPIARLEQPKQKMGQYRDQRLNKKPNPLEIADLPNDSGDEHTGQLQLVKDKTNGESTHIIFCIDFSSSMNMTDVKSTTGSISRWDAVFECIKTFLEDQVQQKGTKKNNQERNNGDESVPVFDMAMVSVVIFNENATTLLNRMPLLGDGRKVRNALDAAQKNYTPKGGTFFAKGLEQAKQIAFSNNTAQKDNVALVFLSDGRPADLTGSPPNGQNKPMPTTYRRNGKKYPAVGEHIQAMKEQHEDRFSFHLICLYSQGKPWLKYLADHYGGTFYEPDLSLDEDDSVKQNTSNQPGHANVSAADYYDDIDDDEVVEMAVKSQGTLLRERHDRALAAGAVYSLTNTTTAGSSMRSTFQSISSSVTAMRHAGSRLQERQGVVIQDSAPLLQYTATRMVLDATRTKFVVPAGEKPHGRLVSVSMHPFAQGGLRNVYRMKQPGAYRQVAKESRYDIRYQERLQFHIETSKCQVRAAEYVKQFNKLVNTTKLKEARLPCLEMLRAEVFRLKDSSAPGGFRYLAVEAELKGDFYEKWNSNNGYVNPSDSIQCQAAQAFSHFSYERSKRKEMVVDIQGSFYKHVSLCKYTDPQLHSQEKEFGRADRGTLGFSDFFKSHHCNFICKKLHLTVRSTLTSGQVE